MDRRVRKWGGSIPQRGLFAGSEIYSLAASVLQTTDDICELREDPIIRWLASWLGEWTDDSF